MTGHSEENATRTVDHGTPPPAVQQALDRLFSKNRHSIMTPPAADDPQEPEAGTQAPVMTYREPAAVPAAPSGLSDDEMRVIQTLRQSASSLTIFVNEVEIQMDVVAVHRTPESICCLVKKAGLRCKIPRSESVKIELEGETIETAFLGSWHTLDWLGVHVVVFPVLPSEANAGA